MEPKSKTDFYREKALELLDLYFNSELTVIYEYSAHIKEDEQVLKKFVSEYARALDCTDKEYNRIVEQFYI